MTPARAFGVLLCLLVLVAAHSQGTSRGSSKLPLRHSSSAGCQQVGSVAHVFPGSGAHLRLDAASKGCSCPGSPSCKVVSQDQPLFAAESMYSGHGTITIESGLGGVPTFTCVVTHGAADVIYPKTTAKSRKGVVVLQHLTGSTTCRVTEGPERSARKPNAVFVMANTAISIQGDPVFGMKRTSHGSLVQVKTGTVAVGTTSTGARVALRPKKQVFVPSGAAKPGAVTTLKPDSTLQKALCTLTPDLKETGITPTSGGNAGSHPQGLAPDRDGNIWFTDNGTTPAIGRYDLKTGGITETTQGLPNGGTPRWIAVDTKGTIWFTIDGPSPAIAELDPGTRAITTHSVGLHPGSVPWAIVTDPIDKRVWFTDQSKTNPAIGTINPKTGAITEYTAGLNKGSHPEGIDVDRKGNLWFTDDNDPNPAIGTVDRNTHKIHEYSTGLVEGSLPRGIAAGPDGRLWFADDRTKPPHNSATHAPGDGLLGAIDPATKVITEYAIDANGGNAGSIPEGLAADANGHVWFTDDGAAKAIGMIDPVTGAVVETKTALSAASEPVGIVVVGSSLWFTDQLPTPRIGRIKALPSC
ncbi:MAG TPA: hypothetical protein VH108_09660 [Gaiellaceae bacterium]|nr:hypothetical protein [Gaiellaceae bacterium]